MFPRVKFNRRLAILLLVGSTGLAPWARPATVSDLRCEDRHDPLGVDEPRPQLSWNLASTERGCRQIAYRILVASSPAQLAREEGDLWDSGRIVSGESVHIPFGGAPLQSRAVCHWKVRVWDEQNRPSAWSAEGLWTMGLLRPNDWSARWITASRWYTPPALRPPGFVVSIGGWADVDLGASRPIEAVRLFFGDAATAPKRFKILGADEPQFLHPRVLVDASTADDRPIGNGAQTFRVAGAACRHVRLWLIDPADPQNVRLNRVQTGPTAPSGEVTVRQLEIISGGKNVALMRPTREFGTQWNYGHAVFLVDGMPSATDGDRAPQDACPTPAAPLFRKAFVLARAPRRATLYVAALGMADVTVNGRPVTDAVLGPPFTDYTKRTVYVTRDITALLVAGENVIGITLGNGFFSPPKRGFGERHNGNGPPRVLLQAEIESADGHRETVGTDDTWKWSRSEITANDTFDGYSEDRSLAQPGWDRPGFDASRWRGVALSTSLGGRLTAPMGPPIRVVGQLAADHVQGSHAYFKTLSSGWPQVRVEGHAGQTITLIGHAAGYDTPPMTFRLATDGPTVIRPRFMYLTGVLDLEVQGLIRPLAPTDVSIALAQADFEITGTFAASNPWLNELHEVDLRTHRNYDGDQPMDPMREKEGWTQDAQGMFETASYLTDVQGFYRKWWHDFADGQDASGYVGSVLPLVGRQEYGWNSPWWSGVVVLLPWQHYQFYGDRRLLAEGYPTMRRYVDFLGRLVEAGSVRSWDDYPYLNPARSDSAEARAGLLSWLGAGDWQNPYGNRLVVPAPLLDMPAWSYYASIVSQTAQLLGRKEDAARYAALAEAVRDRFNRTYLNPDNGLYNHQPDCETTQLLPLALNLVPARQRALTQQRLIDAIHGHQDHQGTGFVGLPWLLHVLTDSGWSALANRMVNQRDYPSWKTLMHDGVFGEDWSGGGAQMPSCGGAIGLWLYQSVLGIRPDPAGPGFKQFILAPQPDPATGLTWAQGSYRSVQGLIGSDWRIAAGHFTLRAIIPPNTTAAVRIPTSDPRTVRESGGPATRSRHLRLLREEPGAVIYAVDSGTYEFTAELSP
jgi:alpha-L-rhamnosidase